MTDNEKKNIGDEFVEEDETIRSEEDKAMEGLFDLVLPPGVPQKMIMEVEEKFNLELVTRKCAIKTVEVESDNLLVLRGELESVNNAHDYIYEKMRAKYNYKR
jgi:hypothetical protein